MMTRESKAAIPVAALLSVVLLVQGCNGANVVEGHNRFGVALEPAFAGLRFTLPVAMLNAPGDPDRFYVVEKRGHVRVVDSRDNPRRSETFFADDARRIDSGPNEAGLLGMAFHPNFTNNAQVFLSYTAAGAPLVSTISRFTVRGGRIDAASEEPLLTVAQPFRNHNGGNIAFGPDGYLYIGLGDGGAGGDPENNGQNTRTLLGAMLRIDVDRDVPYAIPPDNPFAASASCADGGGCPELYAWGLRNPWRWSFDRETAELWLGDVGQNDWEEVDRIVAGGNYGWNVREGAHCYRPPSDCATAGLLDPVAQYDHSLGFSITGGYVYRGSAVPSLRGYYLFADFGSGRVWALDTQRNNAEPVLLFNTLLRVSSFAEDADGELYLLDYGSGAVHKLVPL